MLNEQQQRALTERGLDLELLERLGVESCSPRSGDPWIKIPYLEGGKRVNEKRRTIFGDKKFYQDAGAKPIPWNLDVLDDPSLASLPIIWTEGELDAIAAMQAGFPRVLSVPNGAPAEITRDDSGTRYRFLEGVLPRMADCREIIIAADDDGPGHALLHDLSVRFGRARCKWVRYPVGCKDLCDALGKYGERGVVESINRAQWLAMAGMYRLSELRPLPEPVAYSTGIVGLDPHYRMRLGDFAVILGCPSHGKTSFLNEIACRAARDNDWTTAVASFEQAAQSDHRRNLRTFYHRKPEAEQTDLERREADAWIEKHFVFLIPGEDDPPTLEWVLDRSAAAVVRYGARIVQIDPWNELEHQRPPGMGESEYTGQALMQFRRLARRLGVHLQVATHPTKLERAKDGKLPIPNLYDAAGSAHWANKSDVGVIVHRVDQTRTLIRVQKAKFDTIGEPGEIHAQFIRHMARFQLVEEHPV